MEGLFNRPDDPKEFCKVINCWFYKVYHVEGGEFSVKAFLFKLNIEFVVCQHVRELSLLDLIEHESEIALFDSWAVRFIVRRVI